MIGLDLSLSLLQVHHISGMVLYDLCLGLLVDLAGKWEMVLKFLIGSYPWMGCQNKHILPPHLIQVLQAQGYYDLNQSADQNSSTYWHQGLKSEGDLGLPHKLGNIWKKYNLAIRSTHVIIFDRSDELIWSPSPHGRYTPKLGYKLLIVSAQDVDENGGGKMFGKHIAY